MRTCLERKRVLVIGDSYQMGMFIELVDLYFGETLNSSIANHEGARNSRAKPVGERQKRAKAKLSIPLCIGTEETHTAQRIADSARNWA